MVPELERGAGSLRIRWPDGVAGDFPFIWLRDTDPAGFHPQTGERTFDLMGVALDIAPLRATVRGVALVLEWPDREAAGRFDLDWLRAHRPGLRRDDPAAVAPVIWRGDLGAEGVARHEGAAIMRSDVALAHWLEVTKRYGLSIVEGLDGGPEAGTAAARRVGHLRETNFGVTFEVVSRPDPNNPAYTSDALPLHTDLPNQDLPPGYQFLHCLANEAAGGGSVFCDGFAVAEDLRMRDADAFGVLTSVSIPFRFHDANTDIRARKTVIGLDGDGAVREVCFNAHLVDVLDLPAREMRAFYRAYRMFMAMTRDAAYAIALRLRAGEMVVFDNRRVLHGREAFDPATGCRHLHGCYVDRGEWDSRIRVLRRV